ARIEYEIDSSLLEPDRTYDAAIAVLANSGQRLTLRVRVHVQGPQLPFTRRLLRPFLTSRQGPVKKSCCRLGPVRIMRYSNDSVAAGGKAQGRRFARRRIRTAQDGDLPHTLRFKVFDRVAHWPVTPPPAALVRGQRRCRPRSISSG